MDKYFISFHYRPGMVFSKHDKQSPIDMQGYNIRFSNKESGEIIFEGVLDGGDYSCFNHFRTIINIKDDQFSMIFYHLTSEYENIEEVAKECNHISESLFNYIQANRKEF
jgi:hypothetical protein